MEVLGGGGAVYVRRAHNKVETRIFVLFNIEYLKHPAPTHRALFFSLKILYRPQKPYTKKEACLLVSIPDPLCLCEVKHRIFLFCAPC
jgi:hypothetical protein